MKKLSLGWILGMVAAVLIAGCGTPPNSGDKAGHGSTVKAPTHAAAPAAKTKKSTPVNISIHTAVKDDDIDRVRELLDSGVDVNLRDPQGYTPLHWAAYRNRTAIMKLLLARGAKTDLQDDKGFTPLHRAAFMGFADAGKILIDAGCDVNLTNNNGLTALFIARKMNRQNMVDLLTKAGAKEISPKKSP